MSIRYKIFGAFSVVILLACGIAFFGIRAIGNSGDMVVRLYDGPLMGINHARSAHAALHEARLVLQRGLVAGSSGEMVAKFEALVRESVEDLKVVRERAATPNVAAAREKVESQAQGLVDLRAQIPEADARRRNGDPDQLPARTARRSADGVDRRSRRTRGGVRL